MINYISLMNNMNMTTEEMTMRRKIMGWDKINLGDAVQGVWDNYYYLVVSIDKARQVKIICIEAAYRDCEDKYEV